MIGATGIIFKRGNDFLLSMTGIVLLCGKEYNLTKKSIDYRNKIQPNDVYFDFKIKEDGSFKCIDLYKDTDKPILNKEYSTKLFRFNKETLIHIITASRARSNFIGDYYILIDEHGKMITHDRNEIIKILLDGKI